MTVNQALRSTTTYPLSADFIASIAEGVGLSLDAEASADVMASNAYKHAQARIYLFLAEAPNVSQGGISFSFSESDRVRYESKGNRLLREVGASSASTKRFGYKGESL